MMVLGFQSAIALASSKHRFAEARLEPGTRTFTFVIVTLGVFGDEVDLERLDDKDWR